MLLNKHKSIHLQPEVCQPTRLLIRLQLLKENFIRFLFTFQNTKNWQDVISIILEYYSHIPERNYSLLTKVSLVYCKLWQRVPCAHCSICCDSALNITDHRACNCHLLKEINKGGGCILMLRFTSLKSDTHVT